MWPVSIVCAGVVALAVGACGSSGSDPSTSANTADPVSATTLLKQTFTGSHKVNSGVVQATLTLTPHNSSLLSGDIVLSIDGPFQSEGSGKLPDSDFTLSAQADGETVSAQLISAGGNGYVELAGTAYSLPASTFKHLESSVTSAGGVGTGSSSSAAFKQLGINPLGWLSDATVAGQAQLGGAETTHVHALVDPKPLLSDLSTLLGKAAKLGINSGGKNVPSNIPAATQQQIAQVLGKPSLDVWTGTSDKTLRKLAIDASIAVPSSASKSLGGITSADVALTFQYQDLNQPQQIQAPANPQPFSALRSQLNSLVNSLLQGITSGSLTGTGTGTTGTGTGTGVSASVLSGADQKYAKCIVAAAGNVTKMQACTSLVGSGG
jgi:hypothetical protein